MIDNVPEFYRTRRVKSTRKPHVCGYCKKTIPVGSTCDYLVEKYDGKLYSNWYHLQNYAWECIC